MSYLLPHFLFRILLLTQVLVGAVLCAQPVLLGIDVLEKNNFQLLKDKRFGLLTHPAGVNRHGRSTIQILKNARNCQLVALFGPEHGIYGDEAANVPIDNRIDGRTGLPVYSLYGRYRKPSPEMLRGLDALVIDLQDIGVRSYTYISCMRYAMEACFESDVEVIVLDRPNPLGGLKVDGPPMDPEWMSYVGAFQVPYVHGLTIAELARMAKYQSGCLNIDERTRKKGRLRIVPMQGWKRSLRWPQTGLRWIPTSPYIQNLSAVLGYAMTGLGAQIGGFSHGIGTPYPFRLLRYQGKSPQEVLHALKKRRLPGLDFRIIQTESKQGQAISGVFVLVTDWERVRPTELSFHMMQLTALWAGRSIYIESKHADLFNKHVGSTAWWSALSQKGAQLQLNTFIREWQLAANHFQRQSKNYQLYP
jgi:uncharacterized protein YbbC (DUF1343 family)